MSDAIVETKVCTYCDRNEPRPGVRFCPNCGALLPGFSRYQDAGRVFAILGAQIPVADLKPLTIPPPVSCPQDADSRWVPHLVPLPELTRQSYPHNPVGRRRSLLLDWSLFLLGPVGLSALFVGGLIAVAMGQTIYVLMIAASLLLGRLMLSGIKQRGQ